MRGITQDVVSAANRELEKAGPQEIVDWALARFADRISFASSFSAEDVVVIHMLCKGGRTPRIFTLDTGRLHPETYDVMERIRVRYNVSIESYFPEREAVETLERQKGLFSFRDSVENRKECCGIRKVEPLRRALSSVDAWMTGLRREQSQTRATMQKVELDASQGGIAKVNPLIDWTDKEVWQFVKENSVPYNVLHDAGFPSIGCAPCTRAIKPYESVRSGRWWWEDPENKECGLHSRSR